MELVYLWGRDGFHGTNSQVKFATLLLSFAALLKSPFYLKTFVLKLLNEFRNFSTPLVF